MSTTVEDLEKTIGNKLKVLKLTHKGSGKIAGAKLLKPIQRHRKLLESKVEEYHEIEAEVQEQKLERGDAEEDIRVYSTEIEKRLEEYEKVVEGLDDLDHRLREEEARESQEKEERSKWEIKKKLRRMPKEKDGDTGRIETKLPKLVITKFQGTHLDWQRFWGQFEAEIPYYMKFSQHVKYGRPSEVANAHIQSIM